jgi:hypothetical protein
MYNEQIEALISAALTDGVLTEKEKQILFKKAQAQGIDLDEFEMVLDARLIELQRAERSAHKSQKYGEMRKCPACGEFVPALAVVCCQCRYEFSGVAAGSAAQMLANKIAEINKTASARKSAIIAEHKHSSERERDDVFSPQELAINEIDCDAEMQIESTVANFPVPNTKTDLFDLIMYLRNFPNMRAYVQKYEECVQRAQYLFPNDPIFAQMQSLAKADKARRNGDDVMLGVATVIIFGGFALGIYIGYVSEWSFWGWVGGMLATLAISEAAGFGLGYLIKLIYLKRNNAN